MITLDESVYVECIWYANLGTQDYMGMLMLMDGQWLIKYRFRLYEGGERVWYSIKPRSEILPERARIELFAMFDTTARELTSKLRASLCVLQVQGDGLAAARAIEAQPWGHVRWEGERS